MMLLGMEIGASVVRKNGGGAWEFLSFSQQMFDVNGRLRVNLFLFVGSGYG